MTTRMSICSVGDLPALFDTLVSTREPSDKSSLVLQHLRTCVHYGNFYKPYRAGRRRVCTHQRCDISITTWSPWQLPHSHTPTPIWPSQGHMEEPRPHGNCALHLPDFAIGNLAAVETAIRSTGMAAELGGHKKRKRGLCIRVSCCACLCVAVEV